MAKQTNAAKTETAVSNDANNAQVETPVTVETPKEPTSENLTKLTGELSDLTQAFKGSEFGTPEADKLLSDIVAKKKEIDAEKAAIIRHENELKIAEQREQRIGLLVAAIQAANAVATASPDTPTEVLEGLQATAKDAFDVVANELTSKLPKPATTGGTATTGGSRGNVSEAIKAEYAAILAANPNIAYKDAREMIEAKGYARGTVGAVTLEYRRENNMP